MVDDPDLSVIVGRKSRSLIITIPKNIAERMGIDAGTRLTFGLSDDMITVHKTNSKTPIDVVTKEMLNLIAKVRELKNKELHLDENHITGKCDSLEYESQINEIKKTWKKVYKDFETIRNSLEKTLHSIGETFVSTMDLKKIDDIFVMEQRLLNTGVPSDYQTTLEFIKNIVDRKSKYRSLMDRMKTNEHVDSAVRIDIERRFKEEINSCENILIKIIEVAKSG